MLKRIRSIAFGLCVTTLVGCGGGDSIFATRCGGENILPQIWYGPSPFVGYSATLKRGVQTSVNATVTPESCRGEMDFQVTGTLPPGMTLDQGNVKGTPTVAGTYGFTVSIIGVDGYERVVTPTRSNGVLLTVVN